MNKFVFLMIACFFINIPFVSVVATTFQGSNSPAATDSSVTLPAGSKISVRITDKVDSNRSRPGDVFTGSVDPSVLFENRVVIPRGTEASIQLVDSKKGGHFHGKAEVELQLVSLILNGEGSQVATDPVQKKKGELSTKARAEVRPGAEGAAEVAASANPAGAVALGGIAAFRAPKVEMKPGSRIPFTLSEPFTFTPRSLPQIPPDEDSSKKKKKH